MKTLVIGVGNLLRSDDGVGIHVIDALRKEELGEGVDIRDCDAGLDLVSDIPGYDRLILVDAIQTGGLPGTVYRLSLKDFGNRQTAHSFSSHLNMDLPGLIDLAKRLFPGQTPTDTVIIAIEAEDIMTISDKCTPKVEKAIPKAVELIKLLSSDKEDSAI